LPFTQGRNRFIPPMNMGYDSGAGNSTVALGWSIGVGSIRRRTKEVWRVYGLLKKAAGASDPTAISNDADARAAIQETVKADTQELLNRVFHTPARDSKGNCVPSYSEIRTEAP
jgi:hypothetical protein